MHSIVVEYAYEPPLREAQMDVIVERLQPHLEERGVRILRWWIADDGARGLCEFEAPDIQLVGDAHQSGKIRFVRMWTGQFHEINSPRALDANGSYEELADP